MRVTDTRTSFRLLLLGGLMLVTSNMLAADLPEGLQIGKPFPDLVLPSIRDGKPISVADFRGQKLLLQVFASW